MHLPLKKQKANLLEKRGLIKRTKLEKLADSFQGVRYSIIPLKEDPDKGSIEFVYKNGRIFKKEKKEIKQMAERFYDKKKYLICVTNYENGFYVDIMNNFVEEIFNKLTP